jgi:uncharacterized protein YbjQ (UPF0145 family)
MHEERSFVKFFGNNSQQNDTRYETTEAGVPLDAIKRLKRMAGEGGPPLFTSDLSVDEFVLLAQMEMQPLGLVMGSSIYHIGWQMPPGFFRSQELETLTNALYEARELAVTRLEEEAKTLGADGVVAVRLAIKGFLEPDCIEVVALGTAVKAPPGEDHRRADSMPFTCDLSVQEIYQLYQIGYVPSELVVGNCVYHIRHQGMMQQMMNAGMNIELDNFTQGFYEARELAMGRMQAEAERNNAVGIVGVDITESSFNGWNPNVIEFLAIGTSIVRRKGYDHTVKPPAPTITLSLD